MAIAGSVTLNTIPVASEVGGSKTKDTNLSITLTGLDATAAADMSVAFGKSASAPATFAGLANPTVLPLSQPVYWNQSQVSVPIGGSISTFRGLSDQGSMNAAWTPGDHIWAALFDSAAPSSGDVPLATFGPMLVIA